MPENPRVKVPRSVHSAVFRRIDDTIRASPALKRAIKVVRSWRGGDDDAAPWGDDDLPGLRLTPGIDGDRWYGPGGFENTLAIDCEVAVGGTNHEDVLDLVQAVRRAFYPKDTAACLALHASLREAGAVTGEPLFDTPGVGIRDTGGALVGMFQIKVEVDNLINP